jgi:hypothetical protein
MAHRQRAASETTANLHAFSGLPHTASLLTGHDAIAIRLRAVHALPNAPDSIVIPRFAFRFDRPAKVTKTSECDWDA